MDEDRDGDTDGDTDGDMEGDTDGDTDGDTEGDRDGDTDGDTDGDRDGDMEGDRDGDTDGDTEGDRDGDRDGDTDGDTAHISPPRSPQGKKFVGDLGADGAITWQETGQVFGSPSAWATHCKRLVNPAKKSGCGWASVRYKGQRLDQYKAAWLRRHQPHVHSEEVGTQRCPRGGVSGGPRGCPPGGPLGRPRRGASGSSWCPQGQTWGVPVGVPKEVLWGLGRGLVGSLWVSSRWSLGVSQGMGCLRGSPQGGASDLHGCPQGEACGVPVGVPKEVLLGVPREKPEVSTMPPWRCLRSPLVPPRRGPGCPPRCPQGDAFEPRDVPMGVPRSCLGGFPSVSPRRVLVGPWGGHGPQPPPGAPPQALPSEGEEDELPEEEEEEVGDGRTPAAEPAVSRRTEERSRKPPGRSAAEQGGQWWQQRGCSAGSGGRVGMVMGLWW